jgi:hypothetical protein
MANNDLLLAIADLLKNQTAVVILHRLKLESDQNRIPLKERERRSMAVCLDARSLDTGWKQSRANETIGFTDAAALPRGDASTMLGFMTMVKYGLYQNVYREFHDCPIPPAHCGKYTSNPCDEYEPKTC